MKNKKRYMIYFTGGLLSGFLNGLFGSGGGTLLVPFMTECLNVEEHKAHATAILIISSFTIVSLIFYGMNSFLDLKLTLWVSAGGIAGGFIGAKLLAKLSANVIRKIFGIFMIIAAVRMVMK
ncbi:MAG: sulfite exporter TauE/SafE family protein [Ruminococcaceae bacterium]|nr:sulfite exporter TauE/SafE family protein [Oscillospiraceae bacterium]